MLKPQIILALETSTSACSVALKVDSIIDQLYEEGNNLHSKCLLGMVDQLLIKHKVSLQDVDLLVSGIGPGAFTGLRIGVGVAQGIAFSHSIPVLGVSSLQALAQSATIQPSGYIVAGLDARMSEIYWTIFKKQDSELLLEIYEQHCLTSPESIEFSDEIKNVYSTFIGNAWSIYFDSFTTATKNYLLKSKNLDSLPQAIHLIEYALSHKLMPSLNNCFELSPLYIRNDIAKKKTKNLLLK